MPHIYRLSKIEMRSYFIIQIHGCITQKWLSLVRVITLNFFPVWIFFAFKVYRREWRIFGISEYCIDGKYISSTVENGKLSMCTLSHLLKKWCEKDFLFHTKASNSIKSDSPRNLLDFSVRVNAKKSKPYAQFYEINYRLIVRVHETKNVGFLKLQNERRKKYTLQIRWVQTFRFRIDSLKMYWLKNLTNY